MRRNLYALMLIFLLAFGIVIAGCAEEDGGSSTPPPTEEDTEEEEAPPEDDSGDDDEEEAPPPDYLSDAGERLAARLVTAHLDNGAYDWRQEITDEDGDGHADLPDTTVEGFQNVTGVTALGILFAYEKTPGEMPDGTRQTLVEVQDYLLGHMEDVINTLPENDKLGVSLPNFIYIASFREILPSELSDAEWQTAKDAFSAIANQKDSLYGSDASVVADGIWNLIYGNRSGIPGIRGWDLAFLYKALVAMEWSSAEINWVANNLVDLPTNEDKIFGPASVAHVLQVCAIHQILPSCSEYQTTLPTLVNEDDSIANSTQATAYAVFAWEELGEDTSAQRSYLRGLIGSAGEIESSDGYEYYESMGETLQALIAGAVDSSTSSVRSSEAPVLYERDTSRVSNVSTPMQ